MAAIRDHGDIDRFDLPAVLELVKPLGCTLPNLFDHLRLGHLHAVCFPYRLEPDRQVEIEPDEWPEWYRDSYVFPVYDGYIGELDVAEHGTPVPLHIVPRAARADCEQVLMDGGKAAESAVVYVLRDELVRFTKWLGGAIPDSQHGPKEVVKIAVPEESEIEFTQGDTRETTTDIEAEHAQRVNDHRVETGRRPTLVADNEWRESKGLKRDALRDFRKKNSTDKEKRGGHPPRS